MGAIRWLLQRRIETISRLPRGASCRIALAAAYVLALALGGGGLVLALGGCGYQLAHTDGDVVGPFVVVGGRAFTPYASAMDAAEAGARAELARAGQLASCASFAARRGEPRHAFEPRRTIEASGREPNDVAASCPAILVELLRIDEEAAGIRIDERPLSAGGPFPVARGLRITVTGRARLHAGAEGVVRRDTGDMTTTDVFARSEDPLQAMAAREEAGRLASRRLGERLVRRLLGRPEPTFE